MSVKHTLIINNQGLYIYSINITGSRTIGSLLGISRYMPTHTFATVGKHWSSPANINSERIYWYCAGSFYPSKTKGLSTEQISEVTGSVQKSVSASDNS